MKQTIKQMYFIEIVCGIDRFANKSKYLRAIVKAENEEQAKQKCLDHYRPFYKSLNPTPEGRFYVQCCWTYSSPTKKAVKETIDMLAENVNIPMARHDSDGAILGYRYFNAYEKKQDVIDDWTRINLSWGDIYYDNKISAYVVEIHPHMCMPAIAKVFEGNTKEVYDQACQWVEKNTMKKDHFTFKF
jgi:hypothetical protein